MLYVDSYHFADILGCHTSTLRVLKRYTMPHDVPSKMVGASKLAPSNLRRLHGYEVNHVIAWLRKTLLPGRLTQANERELLSMARGAQSE